MVDRLVALSALPLGSLAHGMGTVLPSFSRTSTPSSQTRWPSISTCTSSRSSFHCSAASGVAGSSVRGCLRRSRPVSSSRATGSLTYCTTASSAAWPIPPSNRLKSTMKGLCIGGLLSRRLLAPDVAWRLVGLLPGQQQADQQHKTEDVHRGDAQRVEQPAEREQERNRAERDCDAAPAARLEPEDEEHERHFEQVEHVDLGVEYRGRRTEVIHSVLEQVVQRHRMGIDARQLAVDRGEGAVLGGGAICADQYQSCSQQFARQVLLRGLCGGQGAGGAGQVRGMQCFGGAADPPEDGLQHLFQGLAPGAMFCRVLTHVAYVALLSRQATPPLQRHRRLCAGQYRRFRQRAAGVPAAMGAVQREGGAVHPAYVRFRSQGVLVLIAAPAHQSRLAGGGKLGQRGDIRRAHAGQVQGNGCVLIALENIAQQLAAVVAATL